MRIVGYCRVSTEGQAAEGVSLDAQRARIVWWCEARDENFRDCDQFVDAGLSGGRADNRPGLQAALDLVCRERGALVVYSLSRLARSTRDALSIAERLSLAGAELVSLTENLDTTTATGKLLFRMLAILAEFERDIISERTSCALAHMRARGERTGQVPYGKRLAGDGKTLVDEPSDSAAADMVRALRARGTSLRRIARTLDENGVRPKNGGARWSPTSVRRLCVRHPPPTPDLP